MYVLIHFVCTRICALTCAIHTHIETHSHTQELSSLDSQTNGKHLYTTLNVNCGFARVAIRELTPKSHGWQQIDKQKRASEFKEQFKDCSNYGIDESYFEEDRNDSLFNRDCHRILKFFKKRWNPKESRVEYEETFSSAKWIALSTDKKQLHSLKACLKDHHNLQMAFPQSP